MQIAPTGYFVQFSNQCITLEKKNWHFLWLLQYRISTILHQTHHVTLYISCTSGLVMCTCTCPYPSPDVILARPCSPPYHMILVISCTSGLVVCTCTCPYPFLMWSLPDPVVLNAWKTASSMDMINYIQLGSSEWQLEISHRIALCMVEYTQWQQ